MAKRKNPRRKGAARTEHGPRHENNETDRNSARARAKWKRRANRSERRTGAATPKFHGLQDRKRHVHEEDRDP